MQFEITNRWTGKVQFTAEIEADENTDAHLKIGLAAIWAVKTGAYLGGAYLGGAYLGGANLGGANLEDKSKPTGERPILILGPLGSRCAYLTVYRTDQGLRVKAGCFFGSDTDFLKAVTETHGTGKHATDYAAAIAFARIALAEEPVKED